MTTMSPGMSYGEARVLIRDGDAILVKGRRHGLNALIKLFTGSEYTHAGLAVWIGGGLYLAEMNAGGNHLVPLSRYADTPFDVYRPPMTSAWAEMHTPAGWAGCVLDSLREKISYDFLDLARIAAHNALNLRLPRTDTGGLVCSAYVARVYQQAGWLAPVDMPSIPSPAALARALQPALGNARPLSVN
jgi:hypothetical protein